MRKAESGNILVYILIAVMLLAALSFVVAKGGRGSAGSLSTEKSRLYGTEIIEYGNALYGAASQLRLRGVKDTDISFENALLPDYENPECAEDACKVFAAEGGGVNYTAPSAERLDSAHAADIGYGNIYIHGASHVLDVGTQADDLVLFIPYLRKDICIALNKQLGIKPVTDEVPSETSGPFAVNQKFTGEYGVAEDHKVSGDATAGEPSILSGKSAGCTQSSGSSGTPPAGTHHYYQVLIAR